LPEHAVSKLSDIRIESAETTSQRIAYRAPIKFGGRVVTDVTLLNVTLDVATRDGRRGRGVGSMPLGNAWAWPTASLTSEQTLATMHELGRRVVTESARRRFVGHPLDITRNLAESYARKRPFPMLLVGPWDRTPITCSGPTG
jgi:hypothetical protein